MNKSILNAIAKSLLESGNCPYDSSCQYGRGNQCIAPMNELNHRLQTITRRINNSPNCLATLISIDPSPWHCENVLTIEFIDPMDPLSLDDEAT